MKTKKNSKKIKVQDLPRSERAKKVKGGVPNAGTTTSTIIRPGDAIIKNDAAAITFAS